MSSSSTRPSMCMIELSKLTPHYKLFDRVVLSSRESTLNINSLIDNPSKWSPIASIPSNFPLNFVTHRSRKRIVSRISFRKDMSYSILVNRSTCDLTNYFSVDIVSVF